MTKHLFAVFAHPDDEAFGPVGTLLHEAASGTHVHLLLLTAGENGINPDTSPDLGKIRLAEWKKSTSRIGVTSSHFLNLQDGALSNQAMQTVIAYLEDLITKTVKPGDALELMSFDFGGLTGHIDHIVATRATATVHHRLRQKRPVTLRLYCRPRSILPSATSDWIYSEPGVSDDEITEVVDNRRYLKQIQEIIDTHATQKSDAAYTRRLLGGQLGVDWFVTKS